MDHLKETNTRQLKQYWPALQKHCLVQIGKKQHASYPQNTSQSKKKKRWKVHTRLISIYCIFCIFTHSVYYLHATFCAFYRMLQCNAMSWVLWKGVTELYKYSQRNDIIQNKPSIFSFSLHTFKITSLLPPQAFIFSTISSGPHLLEGLF